MADLGCGTLDVALQLARRVGKAGRVRALDNDALLVRRMAGVAGAIRTADVRVEEGNAYATGWPSESLDAVHARFLAAPAGRLDGLVAEMHRLVRPGGSLLLQEPDSASWDLPAVACWPRLRALIRSGFALRGGDFDAGRALAGALERAGAVEVQTRSVVRRIAADHPYSALPLAFARQLRPLWVAEGLATPAEIDALVCEVAEGLAMGGTARTFTLVQAWGRRAMG